MVGPISQVIVAVSVTADPVCTVVALAVNPDRISKLLSQLLAFARMPGSLRGFGTSTGGTARAGAAEAAPPGGDGLPRGAVAAVAVRSVIPKPASPSRSAQRLPLR